MSVLTKGESGIHPRSLDDLQMAVYALGDVTDRPININRNPQRTQWDCSGWRQLNAELVDDIGDKYDVDYRIAFDTTPDAKDGGITSRVVRVIYNITDDHGMPSLEDQHAEDVKRQQAWCDEYKQLFTAGGAKEVDLRGLRKIMETVAAADGVLLTDGKPGSNGNAFGSTGSSTFFINIHMPHGANRVVIKELIAFPRVQSVLLFPTHMRIYMYNAARTRTTRRIAHPPLSHDSLRAHNSLTLVPSTYQFPRAGTTAPSVSGRTTVRRGGVRKRAHSKVPAGLLDHLTKPIRKLFGF